MLIEKRININRDLFRKREKLSVKDLKEVKEVFDSFNIKFWLDWGTLLGAVRDGKIIEWDHDIDLGTFDNNWNKIALTIPEFEKRGFNVHFVKFENHKNLSQKSTYFHRYGLPITIFLYQVKGKNAITILECKTNLILKILKLLYYLLSSQKVYIYDKPTAKHFVKLIKWCLSPLQYRSVKSLSTVIKRVWLRIPKMMLIIVVPKNYFERLDTIKFYGMKFNIPSNVEDYIEYKYGKDWKKPKKEWKYWEDDGAIIK